MTHNSAMTSEGNSRHSKFTMLAYPAFNKTFTSSDAYRPIALDNVPSVLLFIAKGLRPHTLSKYDKSTTGRSCMEIS